MPTPTSTSMSGINSHIGSARNSLSDGQVRNLANQGGTISYSQCRWGIQFPAWKGAFGSISAEYSLGAYMDYSANHILPLGWEGVSNVGQCAVYLNFFSSGTGQIIDANSQTGDNVVASWTWLQSGSASDYTIRIDVSSGTWVVGGSSATGVDLAMSTTRSWVLLAETNWDGMSWNPDPDYASVAGTMTIKDSGGNTLITRDYTFNATVASQLF